jgi:ATP-dependent protease ClpP protease subunit
MTNTLSARIRSGVTDKTHLSYRIVNEADAADVWLYDLVGDFGIAAGDFARELNVLAPKPINLHVNSAGGDVFEALAIYAALKNYPSPITAYVDSLAASAASFIVMAAEKIIISKNASMMIHEANGLVIGPSEDMRKMADLLDDATENIASIYADRTGKPVKNWRNAMHEETWYRGDEAVKAGLADEVAVTSKVENKAPAVGFPDLSDIKAIIAPEPNTNPVKTPTFRVDPMVAALSA